jgi:hypothetical protein
VADFCSLDELRSYIAQTGQTPMAGVDDVYLSLAIDSATTAIQTATNRTFEATTAATTRPFTYRRSAGSPRGDYYGAIDWGVVYPTLFAGTEPATLEVDDFFFGVQTITDITVTDYISGAAYTPARAWPYNAASKGDAFTRLEFANNIALPTYPGGLLVTAKWGWASVPNTIKNACLLQASRYYARRGSPMGVAGFGDQGTAIRLQARLDPDVDQMVNDYQRHWAAA